MLSYDTTGDGLTFLTPPLPVEIEITGPVAAKLFVSSRHPRRRSLSGAAASSIPRGQEVVFIGTQ